MAVLLDARLKGMLKKNPGIRAIVLSDTREAAASAPRLTTVAASVSG